MPTFPTIASSEMIEWARTSTRFSIEEAAKAAKVHPTTLEEWEQGFKSPSYAQLEKLAKVYKRPTFVFFLDAPPDDFKVVLDRRTLAPNQPTDFSSALTLVIRTAQEKQQLLVSLLDEAEADPVSFPTKATRESNAQEIGRELRAWLNITITDQKASRNANAAWNLWRSRVEDKQIAVFTFAGIELATARGFALHHALAPVAAVNNKDTDQAKIYTLLHECAHLLLGDSSVSNRIAGVAREAGIERTCDEAAAEALIPLSDFIAESQRDPRLDNIETVTSLRSRYKCSYSALYLQAYRAGFLTHGEAMEKIRDMLQSLPPRKKATGPIPQDLTAISRNGNYFSRQILTAYGENTIQPIELSNVLGMKLKHLPSFRERIYSKGAVS